jgi:hypothetical protein
VQELEGPEPLLGYVPLHLFILFYLTRSCPELLHIYSLLATTDVCPLPSYIYARAHIASHLQNLTYQKYHHISALYILSCSPPQLIRPRNYDPPNEITASNCSCSSVLYSLLSACGACQTDKPLAEASPPPKCVHQGFLPNISGLTIRWYIFPFSVLFAFVL